MKNIHKTLFLLACLPVIFASCSEDAIITYESESNIYFSLKWWPNYTTIRTTWIRTEMPVEGEIVKWEWDAKKVAEDSTTFSFALVPFSNEYMYTLIPVSVLGDVAPVDRRIGYSIKSVNNGREGIDFKVADAYIPANQPNGGILLQLFRTNLITDDDHYSIDFRLEANNEFSVGYDSVRRSASTYEMTSTLDFRISVTNGLLKPERWQDAYLGRWSTKKASILINELGYPEDKLLTENPLLSYQMAYGKLLKKYLQEKQAAGDPVYEAGLFDENGDPVLMDWGIAA